jgi:hypothetical protein
MFHVLQVLVPTKIVGPDRQNNSRSDQLMNRVCPNVHVNCTSRKYYFVVVQLAIEIYSLLVSTANGIKFSFIKMSETRCTLLPVEMRCDLDASYDWLPK